MSNMEHYVKVSCSGFDNKSSHPKIYLLISDIIKEVVCPYCSKNFKYNETESNNEDN